MPQQISELQPGTNIKIEVSAGGKKLELDAVIMRRLKDNAMLIKIPLVKQKLNFGGVKLAAEFREPNKPPMRWNPISITRYGDDYILQTIGKGNLLNRRVCFRVGVSVSAYLHQEGKRDIVILLRDISLSGFSIMDKLKRLEFIKGKVVSVSFEDSGFKIDLVGRVVRTEKYDNRDIYGLVITNIPRNLSPYLTMKQAKPGSSGNKYTLR